MTTKQLRRQFIAAFILATAAGSGLFVYGAIQDGSFKYNYLVWNLFLSYLPLIFAIWINRVLKHKVWSSWEGLLATTAWLLFLPNSFYMISDYIHIQDVPAESALFDSVLLTSIIYTAVLLGFSSLIIVHTRLKERVSNRMAAIVVATVLLLCSFAIYIGRDLRWNSWDVVANPGGLLFDISERLITPASYAEIATVTLAFFALLSTMYLLIWRGCQLLRSLGRDDLI